MDHLALCIWNADRLTESDYAQLIDHLVNIARDKNYGHILDNIPTPKVDAAMELIKSAYEKLQNE